MDLYPLVLPALAALSVAPVELQIAETDALIGRHHPSISPDRPALIGPLEDAAHSRSVSAVLERAYPCDHLVSIVQGVDGSVSEGARPAGGSTRPQSTEVRTLPLCRLDEVQIGPGVALLYVPALACAGAVESFQETVARLRAPDGCPWDRQQTHRSLRQGFQEEAHEVLDALDRGDLEALKEELGDILLHVLLQTQIAVEHGEFLLSDVICHVNAKIVRRHPHVFAEVDVGGVDEVLTNWETIKQGEKSARRDGASALDGIARTMPALARAQSIQRHVGRTGTLRADGAELRARIVGLLGRLSDEADGNRLDALLGDLLFDLAHLARDLGIDAESALRVANDRFEERFRAQERGDLTSC